MGNADDYFSRTEKTVRLLLKETQACKSKVKSIQETILVNHSISNLKAPKSSFYEWWKQNQNDKTVIFEAYRKYSVEAFAGGLLAGSILKIAARAIEQYSTNTTIPDVWKDTFRRKSLTPEFLVGRTVHTVPLGLIIYTGWNQCINHSSRAIMAINHEVFVLLATHSGQFEFQALVDRDSDFNNAHAEYFASIVLDALGWNDYDQYIADMQYALPNEY